MRLQGALLFLFIPAVLMLYLRMPLGVAPSILIGITLMVGHRFLARPFLTRHLAERCFWCGRVLGVAALDVPFTSRGESVGAKACAERCRLRLDAFTRFTSAARPLLAALILAPVAIYLVNALGWIVGVAGIPAGAARWIFKAPIALAVVATSFAYPLGPRLGRASAVDFPVHNLFLLGVGNTLWVFRIVGLYWLAEGSFHLVRRMSGA